MHHQREYRQNPLEISELAKFDEAISQYSQSEQRRRRLDYLRDSVQQIRTQRSRMGILMILCAVIPIFWGFFIILWFLRRMDKSRMENQLENALEYWGIHEVEIDAYVSNSDSMDSDDLIPGL